jgi:ABC-type uncharacterized transport system involved in gliding motility auxiliary subunit
MLNRILGIVGWIGTVLVLAAVALRAASWAGLLRPGWERYAMWAALGGLVLVLVYALGQWREILRLFARRQARLGTVSVFSILVVAGILVAINYISSRENKRWDLTSSRLYTLSDQTQKVLRSLDAPLKITVFAREVEFPRYRDRLGEYEYTSKKVSIDYVDPDKKPGLARQYQITSENTLVFEYKGRIERVTSDAEQDVTNGIIKVVTGQEKKVYLVQGHGEKDPSNSERTGYSAINTALGRDNYKVDKLVLAQQADVPSDASVLIIAGPKNDFLPQEVDALRRYLAKGGKVFFMLDPRETNDTRPLTNLIGLLKEWGIEVGDNVVVDASGVGQLLGTNELVPVAASYPTHPITDRFNLLTAFPLARSVSPVSGGSSGHFAQSFVETSPRSWAETDIASVMKGGEISFDEAKGDKKGPISIGAAVSAAAPEAAPAGQDKGNGPRPESRIAVIGDSDFAANFAVGIQGNRDLFMNTVNWLSQQENLIAIRPREPDDRRVTLTSFQQRTILWLSLVIIPALVVVSGVYTWWRRR